MGKRYIPVMVMHHADGSMEPKTLYWDGRAIQVDKVLDMRPGVSPKADGAGIMYTVQIGSKSRTMYHCARGWFVETNEPTKYWSPDDPPEER